ncbi:MULTISPECIES: hypothetical protein [Niallia]|nr:hypothetical protein [Niallia circulans]QJX61249.1 hypothetical protein HLK66_06030 [Niallia circulans]
MFSKNKGGEGNDCYDQRSKKGIKGLRKWLVADEERQGMSECFRYFLN